jgi:hypothetical protein
MNIEEHFRTMLAMEQKRAQRCNAPCMLMLIDLRLLLQEKKSRKNFKKLMSAIDASTRETDVKGWYDINRIIGVIFTEFETETVDLIVTKVKDSIAGSIPESQSLVQLSYLLFPDDQETSDFLVAQDSAGSREHTNPRTIQQEKSAYTYAQ